jgi:tetratricopeptide (TPR) repeat protein
MNDGYNEKEQILHRDGMPMHSNLPKRFYSLLWSDSYSDWLRAWIFVRDKVPATVTTFDEFDTAFGLDQHGCQIGEILYELEMELHNEGLENLHLMANRAELGHWVYTRFTGESELNLANFRAIEAESLWEIDETDLAEERFQEAIKLFPNIAGIYIHWADCYWIGDRSYAQSANYEYAEAIYREALNNPELDEPYAVEQNLEQLLDEKAHPEKRERIAEFRVKRIKQRKGIKH